jgi:hypothetical protein
MQFGELKRREFITLLGGAAVTWPVVARAQKPAIPVVGFLNAASSDFYAERLLGFRTGLKSTGFVENENVSIEYRWGENQFGRLPAMATELVRRKVAVIIATGGNAAVDAAKAATATIPILCHARRSRQARFRHQSGAAKQQPDGRQLSGYRIGRKTTGAIARSGAHGYPRCRALQSSRARQRGQVERSARRGARSGAANPGV